MSKFNLYVSQSFLLCLIDSYPEEEVDSAILRKAMESRGMKKSQNGFSDTMIRLERTGLVEGRHTAVKIGKRLIRKKFYRLSDQGEEALSEARAMVNAFDWEPFLDDGGALEGGTI